MVPQCGYKVPKELVDVNHILRTLKNHILGIHPVAKTEGGGGVAKSTAILLMLEESITETQYSGWHHHFNHNCIYCKLSDKDIQNQIFEPIPSNLADQIVIDLIGTEDKDEICAKIKSSVVKKRFIFLYRKDFHEFWQSRGKDPERFAARIKQFFLSIHDK